MGELCCVWLAGSRLFLSVLFFLVLFTFGVSLITCLETRPISYLAIFFNFETRLPGLNLAAKFQLGSKVGSQVQTWQASRKEPMENILRPKNLAG